MKKTTFIYPLILAVSFFLICCLYAYDLPRWFLFNKKEALNEWEEKVFKNKVLYVVEPQKEGGYLLAESKQACSGLLYRISFDPKKYPKISWKWRVVKFPQKNLTSKEDGWIEKDDYAARVYVIFPSWFFLNTTCIEYIWDENLPKGSVLTSPYFTNIKLIIAETGRENINNWLFEERNIYEDYKLAYGRAPGNVGAIALMTDTDNTLSTAEASYADIKVGIKNGHNQK